ncbi:MAG: PASTA domain-containing protein, partial [Acidimicrobiales bacterium]
LGVVLYEMVTGGPPFNGDSPLSIAYKHVREEPVPPTGRNPAVPPAYEAVVLHAMAKSPAARYQSAEELRSDLLAFRQGRAIAAPPTVVGGAPTTAVQSATAEAGTTRVQPRARTVVVEDEDYEEEEEKPSRTGLWAILLLVLLAAIAVVVYFVLQSLGLLPGTLSSTETVPSVTGQPVAQAITTLQNDHLSPKVVKAVHAGTPVGNVYGQSPNAGTTLHRGDTVTLDVAKAKTQVGVPKVVGQQYTNAQSALTAKGFKVTQTPKQSSQPKGQVLAQSTPGGQQAPKGSTITLTVSSGPGTIPVPPVVGDTASRASYILGQKGLSLGTNTPQPSTKYPAGQVISTSPPVGQAVAPGTKVDLTVSSGKPTATVPPVTGETQSAASNALTNAGFNPQVTYQTVTDPTQDGIVQSETPAANSTQPKGTTVTIVVGQYTAPPSTTAKPTTTSTTTTSTTTTSTTTPPSSTTAPSSTTVPPGTPTSSPPTT